MSYRLKTLFMKHMIRKQQSERPFDYEAAEAYALAEDAAPTVNNSYYFSAHDPKTETSLYCRLGLRSCHSEVWFCALLDGRRYVHTTLLHHGECPLSVSRREDGWLIEFRGPLTAEDGTVLEAGFCGRFTSVEGPVDFFSHMPPVRTAKAMAGERWSREFFTEIRKNNQVHYEQYGHLDATLTLGGEEHTLSLPCVRDHSFGTRVWDYMNNHVWLMAVNETSQLNFSAVSYPAMSLLEVGNLKDGDAPMAYILSAEYDREAVAAGQIPERLEVTLTLTDGRRVLVTAEREFDTEYLFEDGAYHLLEGVGRFTIDGVAYRGIIEMGWNGDPARIYNGKRIKELKY